MARSLPNIIITGTPGTGRSYPDSNWRKGKQRLTWREGKTSHCEMVASATGLTHVSVTDVVKDHECHDGYDEELQSWIVDEDKVCLYIHLAHGWTGADSSSAQ